MIIIGANEVDSGEVNIRSRSGEQENFANIEQAIGFLNSALRPPDANDTTETLESLIASLKQEH